MKKRIEKDLYSHITAAAETEPLDSVLGKMGSPDEVAREFMDSIYPDKAEVIEKLIQEKTRADKLESGSFEYKSKTRLFGLPLVHVNFRYSYRAGFRMTWKPAVAKGIIAIGNISKGVVSIGGIALGGICFGGIPVGIITAGALSLGLAAFGGVAVGLLAVGGVAIGLGAVGGLAIGKIAIGGFAKGTVAIGGHAVGQHIISDVNTRGLSKKEVYDLIKSAYPGLSDWIARFFSFFTFME